MKPHVETRNASRWRKVPTTAVVAAGLTLALLGGCGTGDPDSTENDDRTASEVLEAAKERPWIVATSGDGGTNDGTIVGSSAGKLSMVRAITLLNEEGWDISALFMASTAAPVQALVQDRVDLVSAPVPTVLAARAAGEDILAFAAAQKFDFVVVGRSDLEPEEFDGHTIAYQSAISSGTMAALAMMQEYPDVQPEYLTMAGTSNRIAALVAGEIDAAAVRIGADTEAIAAGGPGEFDVLYEPLKENPDLLDSVMAFAESNRTPEHEAFMKAFLEKMVETTQQLQDDPSLLEEWTELHELRSVPDADRLLELLSNDVGLSPEIIDQQVSLMDELGQLEGNFESLPKGEEFVDMSIWEAIEGNQ